MEKLKVSCNESRVKNISLADELYNLEIKYKNGVEYVEETREELADKDELIKVLSRTLKIIL